MHEKTPKLKQGDELPPRITMVKVSSRWSVASVGDTMAASRSQGRHASILTEEETGSIAGWKASRIVPQPLGCLT